MDTSPLIDSYGRTHTNLRISVTDRCDIRCFYCMPEEGVKFMARDEILSFEEIERFARIAAGLGVDKLRVTGGEPLVRRDLPLLIRRLATIPGIRDLALTTNGVKLAELAEPLYEAGLRRLNIHLDTLDRERFRQISRRDDLEKVLEGIATAKRLGFEPIKINAVAVKNLVEPDVVPLARFYYAADVYESLDRHLQQHQQHPRGKLPSSTTHIVLPAAISVHQSIPPTSQQDFHPAPKRGFAAAMSAST